MAAVLPTAPVSPTADTPAGFEMTIPYEGGSRFIQMINKGAMKIGRRADNDIVLSERCVSGYHAEFRRCEDGHYEIVDLNSYNGTFVNGKRVQSCRIKSGDVLEFGQLRTQIGCASDPAMTQRLTMTIEQLNKEVSRLSMERDTCRYSISQLKGELDESTKAAEQAAKEKREREDHLAELRRQHEDEQKHLESLLMETNRVREERGRLLVEAESVKSALAELEAKRAKLLEEVQGLESKSNSKTDPQFPLPIFAQRRSSDK